MSDWKNLRDTCQAVVDAHKDAGALLSGERARALTEFRRTVSAQTVIALLDEIDFLRATVDAVGAMPVRAPDGSWSGDEVAALRIELKAYQLQTASYVAKHSVALADLAAMTAARDEACRIAQYVAVVHGSHNDVDMTPTKERIAELRKVGAP